MSDMPACSQGERSSLSMVAVLDSGRRHWLHRVENDSNELAGEVAKIV
jgi:hypothetical protein